MKDINLLKKVKIDYLPLAGGTVTGDVTANTFVGALSGNSTTATTLATARTLTIGNSGKTFNGSGNVAWTHNDMAVPKIHPPSNFGGDQTGITTEQFIQLLNDMGAFQQRHWISRGTWAYASNRYINDTGVGNIHLAGSTVEVISTNTASYTIRIHTATTGSTGVVNGDFIYVNNGTTYSPGWRRLYNSAFPQTSVTGNAGTATTLQNNRTFTINGSAKTFNGSQNVTWTAAEIGLNNYLPLAGGTVTGATRFNAAITTANNIVPDTAVSRNVGAPATPFNSVYSKQFSVHGEANKLYGYVNAYTIGTTSAIGECRLVLGNSTASGTASNAKGGIFMYGTNTNGTHIVPGNNTANATTVTLPSGTGTLPLAAESSGYWGLVAPTGVATSWLRTPSPGLIPFDNTGATSSLGTSSWKFKEIHGVTLFENGTSLANKYLALAGGNMTGTINNNLVTSTWNNGHKGRALVNSTAGAGTFVTLVKGNSTNGYFGINSYQDRLILSYMSKTTTDAGTNTPDKQVTLLNEAGNAVFPGTVQATGFSGNATSATRLQTARTIKVGNSAAKSFDGTGNLEFTLNEIGATGGNFLPLTGGTVTGSTVFQQGTRVHSATGTSGTTGFVKIATIKITNNYQNQPLFLEVAQRGRDYSTLEIYFASTNNTDPGLSKFLKTGGVNASLHKSAAGTWDLYIEKSEGYDNIDIAEFKKGNYMSGTAITWSDVHAASVPSGATAASVKASPSASKLATARRITLGGYLTGSATFDGSGDITITAGIRMPSSGAWFNDGLVSVRTDGVAEVGHIMDFHSSNTTTSDYSTRLQCTGDHKNTVQLPSASGQLALTHQVILTSGGTVNGDLGVTNRLLLTNQRFSADGTSFYCTNSAGSTYHPLTARWICTGEYGGVTKRIVAASACPFSPAVGDVWIQI